MEKLLTVAVPAYNAETTLKKCLDSFLCAANRKLIEVITINDGSKDGTLAIAREYSEKDPDVFLTIDKENGGHGSGINAAAVAARGKYFKVVDADDWVITENLDVLIEGLNSECADVILTPFDTVDMQTGRRENFLLEGAADGEVLSFEDIAESFPTSAKWFSFHGIFYNTEFYRSTGVSLSEGISYEDTEFVVKPSLFAESFRICNKSIYQYQVGMASQSVSFASYVKNEWQLRQVYSGLLAYYNERKQQLAVARREFMRIRLSWLLGTCEKVLLIYNRDRKYGAARLNEILTATEEADAKITENNRKRLMLLRFLSAVRIKPETLEKIYAKMR